MKITKLLNDVLYQSYISYKALFGFMSLKLYLAFKIVTPILQLCFFVLIAKYNNGSADLTQWVIGNAFLLSMYNSFLGVGAIISSDRSFSTLSLLVVSPTNSFYIFTSRAFFHILDATSTVFIGLFVGYLFFDVDYSNTNVLILVLAVFTSMFAAMGLGAIIGSLGLVLRDINMVLNISIFVLMLFTGAQFPITNLPNEIQFISLMMPMARGIEVARNAVNANINLNDYELLLSEFALGLTYFILAYLIFKYCEFLSKKRASLDIY